MMKIPFHFQCVIILFAWMLPSDLSAEVLGFEGFAPIGGLSNVNPDLPYTEAGFNLTPTNSQSAVFDSAASAIFFGSESGWFGFDETNTITLSENDGLSFDLESISLGRSDIGTPDPISVDVTLFGFYADGSQVSETYASLKVLTTFNPAWSNLASVQLTSTDDTGVDNIVVERSDAVTVPEPSSIIFLCVLLTTGLARKRCRA